MLDKLDKIAERKHELDKISLDISNLKSAIEDNVIDHLKLVFRDRPSVVLASDQESINKIAKNYLVDLETEQTNIALKIEELLNDKQKTVWWKK